MRTLLFWLVVLGATYFYVDANGAGVGAPPFTPLMMWKFDGEKSYEVEATREYPFVKVVLNGNLKEGTLRYAIFHNGTALVKSEPYSKRFSDVKRYKVQEGKYTVKFLGNNAKGTANLDYVAVGEGF